jgi:hypothetical protein
MSTMRIYEEKEIIKIAVETRAYKKLKEDNDIVISNLDKDEIDEGVMI